MLKVKPRDGLTIRDPERGDLIEPEGRLVPHSAYWLHRLRDRDVVLVQDDAPAAGKPQRRKPIQHIGSMTEAANAEDATGDQKSKSTEGGAIEVNGNSDSV